MSQIYLKRLTKELKEFQTSPPPGTALLDAESLQCWTVRLEGAPETLYAGESFTLRFVFSSSYPLDAPEVIFSEYAVIMHEKGIHEFALYHRTAHQRVCPKKEPPIDNQMYIATAKKSPKQTHWAFHDDTV